MVCLHEPKAIVTAASLIISALGDMKLRHDHIICRKLSSTVSCTFTAMDEVWCTNIEVHEQLQDLGFS